MIQFYDEEKGKNKPISIALFMKNGEYDQGDVALLSYDDVYDLIHPRKEVCSCNCHPHQITSI